MKRYPLAYHHKPQRLPVALATAPKARRPMPCDWRGRDEDQPFARRLATAEAKPRRLADSFMDKSSRCILPLIEPTRFTSPKMRRAISLSETPWSRNDRNSSSMSLDHLLNFS